MNHNPLRKRPKTRSSKRAQQFTKQIRVLLVLTALIIVGSIIWATGRSEFLRVRAVSCRQDGSVPCPERIAAALEPLSGTPLVFVDHQERARQALDSFPVRIAHLEKSFSGTLTVEVVTEIPAYAVVDALGTAQYISESGKPFAFLIDESLEVPVVTIAANHRSLPSEFHHSFVRLLKALEAFGASPEKIAWSDHNHIELTIPGLSQVIITDLTSIEKTIAIIQVVRSQNVVDQSGEEYLYLDTRFELPVLRNSLEFPIK